MEPPVRSDEDAALKERVAREKAAHEEDDVLANSVRLKSRFPHLYNYPSHLRLLGTMESLIEEAARDGRVILDYGCGKGENSLKYLGMGGQVHGIDISSTYIDQAATAARAAGHPEDRFHFSVMDAHAMTYDDNTFDLIFGYGILHHLNPEVALSEIHRVLKPGGRVLLQEPLGGNPLLKLYRLLTPHARTPDEEPFSQQTVRELSDRHDWDTSMLYCGLVELPLAMLTSLIVPDRPDTALIRAADRIESWMHRRNWLLGWNQYIVFNMVKR